MVCAVSWSRRPTPLRHPSNLPPCVLPPAAPIRACAPPRTCTRDVQLGMYKQRTQDYKLDVVGCTIMPTFVFMSCWDPIVMARSYVLQLRR